MSRDKQIEEMAKVVYELGSHITYWRSSCELIAEALYNAGYRKASDVAEEIFAEIEVVLNKMFEEYAVLGQADCCMITEIIWRKLSAELKKKYIGEDINVTTKDTEEGK